MRSRFLRFSGRSGWRGVVLLSLLPVLFASFGIALGTHGVVRSAAGVLYGFAATAVAALAWQISFGRRGA